MGRLETNRDVHGTTLMWPGFAERGFRLVFRWCYIMACLFLLTNISLIGLIVIAKDRHLAKLVSSSFNSLVMFSAMFRHSTDQKSTD